MNTSLTQFLDNELLPRLTPELVFTDPAHKWQQRGAKWKGGCPFHTSRSGNSFYVEASSLLWRCPACEIGGGPIQYIGKRLYNDLNPRGETFIECVKELARRAGVSLPERDLTPEESEKARKQETRRVLLAEVSDYAETVLWSDAGAKARAYLQSRGFTDERIRDLHLGLYPLVAEVRKRLKQKNLDMQTAQEAGLLWRRFEGFILFPWMDATGRPLTLYGKWHAKELPLQREHPGWSSDEDCIPDAPIPKTMALPGEGTKASPLYFDRARRAGHKKVVAGEGVTDAALGQVSGLTEFVAYVAAQFSAAQIETLKRYGVTDVTIVPDPDGGGDKGALSNVKRLTQAGIASYVAERLPDGLDPDEFLLRDGVEAFRALIRNATPGHVHLAKVILGKHDTTTDRARLDATQEIAAYVADLRDPRHRADVLRLAAEATGYSAELLETFVNMAKQGRQSLSTSAVIVPEAWTEENWEPWAEQAQKQEMTDAEAWRWIWGRWYAESPFPDGKKEVIVQRVFEDRWTTIRNYGNAFKAWPGETRQGLTMTKCLALAAQSETVKQEFADRCYEKGLTVEKIKVELRERGLLKLKDPTWVQMLKPALTHKEQQYLTDLLLKQGSAEVRERMRAAGLLPTHGLQPQDEDDPQRSRQRRPNVNVTSEPENGRVWDDDPPEDEDTRDETEQPPDAVRSENPGSRRENNNAEGQEITSETERPNVNVRSGHGSESDEKAQHFPNMIPIGAESYIREFRQHGRRADFQGEDADGEESPPFAEYVPPDDFDEEEEESAPSLPAPPSAEQIDTALQPFAPLIRLAQDKKIERKVRLPNTDTVSNLGAYVREQVKQHRANPTYREPLRELAWSMQAWECLQSATLLE